MEAFSEGIESFVVFHDAKGEIVHVHKHVSFNGLRATEERVKSKANELFARSGRKTDGVQSLYLETFAFEQGKRYRVDPTTRALVGSIDPRQTRHPGRV
jgi:hypothetical protein